MLDKKQIWAIFLFKFKLGYKSVETICNINETFDPGTANERTLQQWFKKLCKGNKSLEDEEHSGQLSEVDNDQLRAIIEADPLTTTWEAGDELNMKHSMVIWHLQQIAKLKKLDKWVPHELTTNQKKKKNHCFEVLSSLILHNDESFLNQTVGRVTQRTVYHNHRRTTQLDWEEAPKHFPKPSESESRSVVSDSLRCHGLCGPWNSQGQNIGVGSLSLLQGISPS